MIKLSFSDRQGRHFSAVILPNSVEQFVNFRKILRRCYPLWPVGIVLTDNTSECEEFIVTCNTKTHYFWAISDENIVIMSKEDYYY